MAALLWEAMDPETRASAKAVLDSQLATIIRHAPWAAVDSSDEVEHGLSRGSRPSGGSAPGGAGEPSPARGESVDRVSAASESTARGWVPGTYPRRQPTHGAADDWLIRQWNETLRRELDLGGPRPSSRGQQFRLLYILEPDAAEPHKSRRRVAIRPLLVGILKDGAYGREKRFDWYSLDRDPKPNFLAEADERALILIEAARRSRSYGVSSYSPVELHPDRAEQALERAVETGRCHWRHRGGPRLVRGESRVGHLTWKIDAQGLQRAALRLDGESVEVLPIAPPWYVDEATGECGPIETGIPARAAAVFLNAPLLAPEAAAVAHQKMSDWANDGRVPAPMVLRVVEETSAPAPTPRLFLHGVPVRLPFRSGKSARMPEIHVPAARLRFSYGEHTVDADDPQPTIAVRDGEVIRRVHRNLEKERDAASRLDSLGLESYDGTLGSAGSGIEPNDFVSDDDDPMGAMLDFVIEELPSLEKEGWIVETDPSFPCRLVGSESAWYADIDQEPGQDWFDLEMGVTIEGKKVNLLPLLVRLIHEDPEEFALDPEATGDPRMGVVVPLDDGRLLPVPAERARRILGFLRELYDGHGLETDGRLRLSVLQAPALAEVEEEAAARSAILWSGGEQLRELGRRLRDFRGIEALEPPRGLDGVLRHYQAEGVSWLQFLRTHGLGGLLADDMGLGKTIQGLAHLIIEKESGRADRPSLVVAPTSLMVNWEREAARFAPGLRVLRLQGPDRHARLDSVADADIVLTTYPLLWRDREVLLAREYHVLILDEAQFLKNHRTKGARIAREIRARHRLGFTGTPFENRLMELWSLFDILMPGVLGDEKRFRKAFVGPIEKRGDGEKRQRLAARIHPFLLRRTKDKVATELPRKTEIVQAVELSEAQADLYETIRLAMHERVRAEVARKGLDRARIVILDALLKLRQVCCDPRLLKTAQARDVPGSAKLEALLGMLEEMAAEGRRVLLFSQFTSMLALIEPELKRRAISFVQLTGKTRDRSSPVAAFQAGEASVFLISLKAGGTGLNLTAADTVVLYDPWWNPAVEDQAMDRAHRIGQRKPVFVYKLIAAGSVEEKILAMQGRKRDLVKSVLAPGEDAGVLLTEKDLEVLFEPIG